MDTHAQMQAIVDRLTGGGLTGAPSHAPPDPSALQEPWRTIYRHVTPAADRADAETILRNATTGLHNRRQLTQRLAALLPADAAFHPLPSLHDLAESFPPVEWLWPSWIPNSMVTLFGAAPGAGKSLVALDLARRIIAGQPFPDGTPVPCPGSNVLIVDAEGAPDLLNQRAKAWGIDRRRLFLMLSPDVTGLVNLADTTQQLRLVKMCGQLRPALVIIDSLAAATARSETSLEGARIILGSLTLIARKLRLALLVIHHLRKRATSRWSAAAPQIAPGDLRGSSHLSAAARSVIALSLPAPLPTASPLPAPGPASPHPTSPAPTSTASLPLFGEMRRLEVIKTNLCRRPPPLGLLLEGDGFSVPTLRYTPYVETLAPPSQLDLCARWLLEFLAAAGAPVRPADVVRAAREVGFSRRTLYRARQILAGAIVDLGNSPHDPHKRWTLPTVPSPGPPP
jgi:hypothetical protein